MNETDDQATEELDTMIGAVIHVAGAIGEIGCALAMAAMLVDIRRRRTSHRMTIEDVLGSRRLETLVRHASQATKCEVPTSTVVHLVDAAVQAAPKVGGDVLRDAISSIALRVPCTDCNGLRAVLRSGLEVPCTRCRATGIDPVQTRSEGDG